jgi:two-component system response regulator
METKHEHIEILLVEDNEEDAGLIIRSLRQHNLGNHLVHLQDGAQALDFIFARGAYAGRKINDTPRMLLLDLKMPKVGGVQVLQAIKGDDRTKLIPVIIMTSSREDKDIEECYRLGVNSYVVKPVEFENFARAVSELGMYWMVLNQPAKI